MALVLLPAQPTLSTDAEATGLAGVPSPSPAAARG